VHCIQVLCQSRLYRADYVYFTYLMLQRERSHLNGRNLTVAKFKPLIFSICGFALSYTANMFILMIVYDFCLLPGQFYYIIVYTWTVESCVQIADRCGPWNIPNGADNLVLQALQF
jgi:hypothetical protein